MTIKELKSKVTPRDLASKSVFVTTTLVPIPLRLTSIGREYVSVLSCGCIKKIDPIIVTDVVM